MIIWLTKERGRFIINIFLWIWSHFPILCLSDDDNFATLQWRRLKDGKAHLRVSLLNIILGDCILYLFTLDINQKKIEPLHIVRLSDMEGILLTDEKINDIQNRYKDHINDLGSDDLQIEKEKLCYHIQNEEKRIDTSIEKLNIYATIILTVLPLVLAITDLKKITTLSIPLLLSVVFMVYSLLNICAYIFRAIKIQGIMKSSFLDLRLSEQKDKEILLQYQYDWQQLKYKAQLFVSFVLNLQEWVALILVLAIFFAIGISCEDTSKQIPVESQNANKVITVDIEDINEPYSGSAIEWQALILDIEKEQYKEIIFIVNQNQDVLFIDTLDKYDDLEIKILCDATIEIGQLKIIREE